MRTAGGILEASIIFLQDKKVQCAQRYAEELISHALSIPRTDLYLQFERLLTEEQQLKISAWNARLAAGEPIEYILGFVKFFGCKIRIDPRVLVPRPETEILVDHVSQRLGYATSVWDLCTGSGCIGVSLKKNFPNLAVSISDQSKDALAVARENVQSNEIDVEVLEGDLLAPFYGRKTDIVVVNPPYLSLREYFSLDRSVREFEPKMALVGGRTGVEFYERLAFELPPYLHPGARVFLEISATQGGAVQNLFSSPYWKKSEILLDWSGKTRFFFLEIQ